jgi:hypothetical protein
VGGLTGHICSVCGTYRYCFTICLHLQKTMVIQPMASYCTSAEYLFSTNNNVLIPLMSADNEDDNLGDEANGHRLYDHIPR